MDSVILLLSSADLKTGQKPENIPYLSLALKIWKLAIKGRQKHEHVHEYSPNFTGKLKQKLKIKMQGRETEH